MYRDIRVLFIGNSHTYFNDMPHLFAEKYSECTGCHAEVTMLAYSGRTLEWHMEEQFSVRFNLLYGHYDYCVIQQAAHPFPGKDTTFEFGKKIIEICNVSGTKPVLFMTWAEKAYPENQQKMTDCYSGLAAETVALLAPVGLIWQSLLGDPDIDLFFKDGEHASVAGDLLIALTMCALFVDSRDLEKATAKAIDFRVAFENGTISAPITADLGVQVGKDILGKLITAIRKYV
ncbi:MAG: hypothetical protein IKF10_05325 [Lachnospiraceae bacterium]|nr:hypothetical protein [Lachnospiraceae bacterium]